MPRPPAVPARRRRIAGARGRAVRVRRLADVLEAALPGAGRWAPGRTGMNAVARLRRLAAGALFWIGASSMAAAPSWPDVPYSQFANNAKLEAVLAEFAAGFGLSLSI